jgi:hypothetical protein
LEGAREEVGEEVGRGEVVCGCLAGRGEEGRGCGGGEGGVVVGRVRRASEIGKVGDQGRWESREASIEDGGEGGMYPGASWLRVLAVIGLEEEEELMDVPRAESHVHPPPDTTEEAFFSDDANATTPGLTLRVIPLFPLPQRPLRTRELVLSTAKAT